MTDLAMYFCSFRDDLGIYVRLKRESNFARYLNHLKEDGAIADWWYEKDATKFPVKRGTRFYTPDFKVLNAAQTIEYYGVKGYFDRKSRALALNPNDIVAFANCALITSLLKKQGPDDIEGRGYAR